jgi:hypothetical protein
MSSWKACYPEGTRYTLNPERLTKSQNHFGWRVDSDLTGEAKPQVSVDS